jgi:PAS domain S-box-containing protein
MKRRPLDYLAQVSLLVAIYFGTARLGLRLDPVGGFATAVWPPTGIALAALCLFGVHLWPGVALAAFLVNLSTGASPLAALGMATGNTLEAVIGAYLLQRVVGFRGSLDRLRDVIGLFVLAGLLSTLVSATIGVASGWLGGVFSTAKAGGAWWTWWIGDMMGDLVVAPLLFVWREGPPVGISARQRVEAAFLVVATLAVGLMVFSGQVTTTITNAGYLLFPFLIWAALAFGPHGAATAVFGVSLMAIWGTAQGLGPFAGATLNEGLLGLQTFMGVAAVTVLVLAADVSERKRAQAALREARDELDARVRKRTAELGEANAALAEEIGERRQVEDSLRRSERQLAEAQEIAHLGSWEWDIPRNVITWSDELYRIFGLKPGDAPLTYETYRTYLHPEDRELAHELVQRSYHDHQPFEFDHRVLRADQTVRWVSGRGAVILGADGQPVRMSGTALDITERRQAEDELRRAHDELEVRVQQRTAELERANRAKDRFLTMLAHELRNPLAPILNAVYLLSQSRPSEPRLARALEIIERQVNHQAHLLDDLLNVARIERGMIELNCEPLDLRQLVQSTADDYRGLLQAAGVVLSLELPDEAVWVEGDPTRLAQVVSNLLQNAARFTGSGGQVHIQVFRYSGIQVFGPDPLNTRTPEHLNTCSIVVRDTGIGIEPEMLPHIFESFTQADRSLDRSRGGLGLGLALVKGLVELHRGEVRAFSEGAGRGAEFTVLLPTIAAPVVSVPVARPALVPTALVRVLVVEDNVDTAHSLRDLLELCDHTVQVAYSGPEAVVIASRFCPEVVLCDLGLPGMDGYQVAAALRQNPATASARLIAISGYGQEEAQRRSAEVGFHAHLIKPIDFDELRRLLQVQPECGTV